MGGLCHGWGGGWDIAPHAVCRCWWAEQRTWRGQLAVLFLENETLFHEGEKYVSCPSRILWFYPFNMWTLSLHDNSQVSIILTSPFPLPWKGGRGLLRNGYRGPFRFFFWSGHVKTCNLCALWFSITENLSLATSVYWNKRLACALSSVRLSTLLLLTIEIYYQLC